MADLSTVILNDKIAEGKIKKQRKFTWIILISLLNILTISLVRLPYTGEYIDSYLFEYINGIDKYFLYVFIYLGITLKMFDVSLMKTLLSKRVIVLEILFWLFGLILTSSIIWAVGIHSGGQKTFFGPLTTYNKEFWKYANDVGFYDWFKNFTNPYYSGGIIGEFFMSISFGTEWIAIFLVEFILLFALIVSAFGLRNSFIFKKIKARIVHSLGGYMPDDETKPADELNGTRKDKKLFKFIDSEEFSIKLDKQTSTNTPPLSFLVDTAENNEVKNRAKAVKTSKEINKFVEERQIGIKFLQFNVMPSFTEYVYSYTNENNVNKLIYLKQNLVDIFKTDKFDFLVKNKKIYIEVQNVVSSKVSIKDNLTSQTLSNNQAAIGITYNSIYVTHNFTKDYSLLVIGKPGSGAIMQASSILTSYLYVNSPKDLKLLMCCPFQGKVFESLYSAPQMWSQAAESYADTLKNIDILFDELEQRKLIFNKIKVNSLTQYNKQAASVDQLPKILFCLFDVDKFLEADIKNIEILQKILNEESAKLGVQTLLYAQTFDPNIFNDDLEQNIKAYYVFKLGDEETSRIFLKSPRALTLFGHGDGYALLKSDKSKTRIQSCYISKEEIKADVKIMNTFYNSKPIE